MDNTRAKTENLRVEYRTVVERGYIRMPDRWTDLIIQARFTVAALGEAASPPWWRSQATPDVGGRMIQRLFPRTVDLARLELACRVALLVHDQRITGIGRYHLFRLPAAEEASIRDRLAEPAGRELIRNLAAAGSPDARMKALSELAGKAKVAEAQGPVACGTQLEVRLPATLQRACAIYLGAFRSGRPAYPYLEAKTS